MMMGYPMGAPRKMWFADIDEDADQRWPWQPILQLDGMCMSVDSVHFATRDECEWFIREHLVGSGWMDGPARYACPDCGAPPEMWCRKFVSTTGNARLSWHSDRMRYQFGGWPE